MEATRNFYGSLVVENQSSYQKPDQIEAEVDILELNLIGLLDFEVSN
jgi:hypothetical protein